MASDYEMNVEPEATEFLYSDIVKSRLLHVFQQMTNKITPTDFNDIFKEIEESDGVVRNVDEIAQTFKEKLYQSICDNFKEMWHDQDVDLNLNMLHFCIDKCKNNTLSWRPTGKMPEEQTKHIRMHYLKKKIAFIENAVNVLSENLKENILPEVDAKRAEITNLIERRNLMSQQIDIRMAQISKRAENQSDSCQ